MTLLQLEYFYKIAHSESLTQAAKELRVAQPSLSRMIKALENEFGVQLFYQEGRNIYPNENGKIFLSYTTEILNSIERMREALEKSRELKNMHINVGVFTASTFFPEIVSGFKRKYPNIKVSMTLQKYEGSSGKTPLDVIVSSCSPSKFTNKNTLLFKERILLAVPSTHPIANRKCVAFDDLENEVFIAMSEGKALRELMDEYCGQAGFSPNIALESDDPSMIRSFIASGFGVSFVPEKSWARFINGQISLLSIEDVECERYVYYNAPSSAVQSTASKLFQKYIIEFFHTNCL